MVRPSKWEFVVSVETLADLVFMLNTPMFTSFTYNSNFFDEISHTRRSDSC